MQQSLVARELGRRRLLTCGEGLCSDSGSTAARLRVLGVAAGVDGCRVRLGPLFVGRRPTWACAPGVGNRRDPRRGVRAAAALRGGKMDLRVGPAWQRVRRGVRARGVGAGRGVRAGRESREEWARRAGPCGWIGPE